MNEIYKRIEAIRKEVFISRCLQVHVQVINLNQITYSKCQCTFPFYTDDPCSVNVGKGRQKIKKKDKCPIMFTLKTILKFLSSITYACKNSKYFSL